MVLLLLYRFFFYFYQEHDNEAETVISSLANNYDDDELDIGKDIILSSVDNYQSFLIILLLNKLGSPQFMSNFSADAVRFASKQKFSSSWTYMYRDYQYLLGVDIRPHSQYKIGLFSPQCVCENSQK